MERSIELIVKPKWDELEEVRNKSSSFLKSYGFQNDIVDALIMVISELIENGIKYGSFTLPENNVMASIHITSR